jgi:hypothetical protein
MLAKNCVEVQLLADFAAENLVLQAVLMSDASSIELGRALFAARRQ